MLNIVPLKDKVLVAQWAPETKTVSGIVLSSTRGGDTLRADVIAVGPDVKDVMPGNTVLVDWKKCTPVKVSDGIERALIAEEHIIAVFEK